jgi:hypothetical protein
MTEECKYTVDQLRTFDDEQEAEDWAGHRLWLQQNVSFVFGSLDAIPVLSSKK